MNAPAAAAPCRHCGGKQIVIDVNRAVATASVCPDCSARCKVCDGSGLVPVARSDGYQEMRRCECALRRMKVARFDSARIPRSLAHCSLESYTPKDATQAEAQARVGGFVKSYVSGKRENHGLLLMGNVGVGKSHLLAAALRCLALEKSVRCRYAEIFLLLGEIKAGYDSGKGDREILEPLFDVEVLALDELGKGRCNEWELTILDEIISQRYNTNRTTIFATNYTLDANTSYRTPSTSGAVAGVQVPAQTLGQRVGERIVSRLHEMCEFVTMAGSDYRRSLHMDARKAAR